ncbi:hypothetical protein PAMA_017694 [Pampus argenteus]
MDDVMATLGVNGVECSLIEGYEDVVTENTKQATRLLGVCDSKKYGEEEVCSDRLDTDFPDIDLSQLDTSDFDSVNCLSELQWCNDQSADASPAYSTPDELFEIEEENAALLAALTDSLDGIVDAEVGGLSVFPALGEGPDQEEEEEDNLPLSAEDFSQSLGAETEDPSLNKASIDAAGGALEVIQSRAEQSRVERLRGPDATGGFSMFHTDTDLLSPFHFPQWDSKRSIITHSEPSWLAHKGAAVAPLAMQAMVPFSHLTQIVFCGYSQLCQLKKLLLTPPNVPAGIDAHKDGVNGHRYSNRSLHLRPVRPLVKSDLPQERKPRAVRPAGRLCTELHRHLTTAQDTEDTAAPDTEEDEEEEEDDDSESEEEEEGEEEEEESSSSEVEGVPTVAVEPAKPQFSSEKELHSVVELIKYMHTYCLPTRKQQGWERKDLSRPRARPEASRPAATNAHSRVVLVAAPGTSGGLTGTGNSAPRRLPFARRREMKANSLLRELLQQSSSFDVSKPYRLHSPPYSSPNRGGVSAPSAPAKSALAHSPSSTTPKPELHKDSSSPERRNYSSEATHPDEVAEESGSFSVRRSRRLASFPSRFAKRLRPGRAREGEMKDKEEREERRARVKLLPTQAGGGTTTEMQPDQLTSGDCSAGTTEPSKPCCHSGLTPPTTPPHKPVEDELFKPAEGGKGGGGAGSGDGAGSESVHAASNTNTNVATKGSSWLSRTHHQRKLPEQTELYAQLRRMGQAGDSDAHCNFGDHDYCALSLRESRKRSAAMLGAMLQAQGGSDGVSSPAMKASDDQVSAEENGKENAERLVMSEVTDLQQQAATIVISSSPPSNCQSAAVTPPASEEEAERSSASRSPSPILHLCPDSPSSKTDSSENSEICPDDKQRNKAKSDECLKCRASGCFSSHVYLYPRLSFVLTVAMVSLLPGQLPGVLHPQPAKQRDPEHAEETLPDEAGPGPVKSKYDALDFDTLLKEAQKSLHR